jgi:hypothetical protein
MYRLNHSGDFFLNLYLDLIFNFITSEKSCAIPHRETGNNTTPSVENT